MSKSIPLVAVALLVAVAASVWIPATSQNAPPPPPAPAIPGITAPDPFPRGCVGCHLNYTEMKMDVRLSTLMHQWESGADPAFVERIRAYAPAGMQITGKHPMVEDALADIPNRCLTCHGRGSTVAPPFAQLLHGIHLAGGEQSYFVTMFQGHCTHCHKLDRATGSWSFASGAEQEG